MITEDFSNSLAVGAQAPDFNLLDTQGDWVSLKSFEAHEWLVLQFTCNHCPYVLGSDDRLRAVVAELEGQDVAWAGICSNDPVRYPQDNYERMQERADALPYRYLHDPTQETARRYGAQVTPEFFIFRQREAAWTLAWHGTIDDSPRDAQEASTAYLLPALVSLLEGKALERMTTPVQGCSIKWL
jgi:peroxiredoxin